MIQNTKEYDKFKFREDNRARIDQAHVRRLVESIKSRNLLNLRPISINDKWEIMDGQHRLLAAKALDTEIYYEVQKLQKEDIIVMNISKSWGLVDYFNYFCFHQEKEYIKLREFIKRNNVSLKIALNMLIGEGKGDYYEFRQGKFKFDNDIQDSCFDVCWDTINYVKRMNGYSSYTQSSRFWKAMLKLINHKNFDAAKWMVNLGRFIERVGPRASTDDYSKLLMDIFNWKNNSKVDLLKRDFD
jgi:hypothetical protein